MVELGDLNAGQRTTGRRWARIGGSLLLAGGALLLALLLGELALRVLGIAYPVYVWTDPVRGVAHIPGAAGGPRLGNGHRWIEINSEGWRGPEIPLAHPAGTYRIALLGDSFIEAFEVPFAKTVGEVIARRLTALSGRPVQVLNFGHGGYGTAQELLTLRDEVWKYSPDLVLLAVTTGNDISDNYRPLKRYDYVPYFVFRGPDLVLDSSFAESPGYRGRALWTRRFLTLVQHSRLAQLINRARHLSRREERHRENATDLGEDELGLRNEVQLPPSTAEWKEAWRVTEAILAMMGHDCRSHGTPFAIVTLTRGIQVSPFRERKERFLKLLGTRDLYYPERRLDEFGRREGIPVFNLAPPMAAMAEREQVYFHADHGRPGVGHWNEAGHAAAGQLIAAWLADSIVDRPASAQR